MLRASVVRRSARARRGRVSWLACFALFALAFATPITQLLVTELVTLVAQDDCCEKDDDCKEEGRCPGPCQTCHCCPHANALASTPLVVPARSIVCEGIVLEPDDHCAEGHVSPPFRPPTA
jgi:hypothetical protein